MRRASDPSAPLSRSLGGRLADEQGVSLVELLVVVFLFGIVGSTLGAAFVAVDRTTVATQQQQFDLADATVGIDAAARVIRSALRVDVAETDPVLLAAEPDRLFFHASPGTVDPTLPTRVELVVDGTRLLQHTTVPTGTYGSWDWTGPPTTRELARELVAGTVFTYYDETHDPFATPPAEDPIPAATLTDPAVLATVQTVVVELTSRQLDAFDIPTTTVRTRVRLANNTYVPEVPS